MSKKSNARLLNALKKRPFHDWNGHRYFTDGNICKLNEKGQVVVRYTKGDTDWITARMALSEAAKKARETPVVPPPTPLSDEAELRLKAMVNGHTPSQQRAIDSHRKAFREMAAKLAKNVSAAIAEPSTPPSPGG